MIFNWGGGGGWRGGVGVNRTAVIESNHGNLQDLFLKNNLKRNIV